jgi:hypothetical protein
MLSCCEPLIGRHWFVCAAAACCPAKSSAADNKNVEANLFIIKKLKTGEEKSSPDTHLIALFF